jgi:hypothetical protein
MMKFPTIPKYSRVCQDFHIHQRRYQPVYCIRSAVRPNAQVVVDPNRGAREVVVPGDVLHVRPVVVKCVVVN